jgi:transcriptional regulator with XRE-family HTH domain
MEQKIKQDISIGDNIRQLRKKANLTQEQVVARLQLEGIEISRSTYSQIECGTYNIKVTELIALSKLFHTDYNSFFKNIGSMPADTGIVDTKNGKLNSANIT